MLFIKVTREVGSGIIQNGMKKLLEYNWPGNVRELQHIIEKAVILSEDEILIIPEFNAEASHIGEQNEITNPLLPLAEIERRHILNVLEHSKWRIRGEKGAAKILGLKPSTLDFRIKKLGIKK